MKYKLDLIFFALIIAALAVGTYERNRVWKTEMGLWQDCAKKSPNKDRPYNNIGAILMRSNKLQEAKSYVEKAVSLKGVCQTEANNNLGIIYGEEERFDEAFLCFEIALKITPNAAEAENNYGLYKFKSGDYDESLLHLRRALRVNPQFDLARMNFQRIAAERIKKERKP